MKFEKPSKGNKARLTIEQHVFPRANIARFADTLGYVNLFDIERNKLRPARPSDTMFVAKRAWDQRAEKLSIPYERAFQKLMNAVTSGLMTRFDFDAQAIICDFFALWQLRAERRELISQSEPLKGVLESKVNYTHEERDRLEAKGITALGPGNTVPTRHFNGIGILQQMTKVSSHLQNTGRWAALHAAEGEFLVPDRPSSLVLPVTPKIILAHAISSRRLMIDHVKHVNREAVAGAQHYIFARDLARCPR